MKKAIIRLLALTLAVLLCGCSGQDWQDYMSSLGGLTEVTAYADMTYTRPDMAKLEQSMRDACEIAKGQDVEKVLDAIYAFYDEYDWFYTAYALADIKYSTDLTDIYWEQEYNFCAGHAAEVDAALEKLYMALADSPCRPALEHEDYFGAGFFEYYEGEATWDETFLALTAQESQLQSRYYELSEAALAYEYGSDEYYVNCGDAMAELLVELIRLRQEIAAYWGYDSYDQVAYDFYYYRDYTSAQAEAYMADIRKELTPLYRSLSEGNRWDGLYDSCSEKDVLDFAGTVAKNMGGTVKDAFALLENGKLYDITYSENKYDASFETYLDSYYEPFIFMNPYGDSEDKLTFLHEFGHFCNDYACYGSYASVDVSETFSQGMEYLCLFYGEDTEKLTQLKMLDSLCIYVEQAAYASFEQRMYTLSGENLSVEGLYDLYDQVVREFGLDAFGYDKREFITITHYYTNPMYIISYVVSNDAAMQLYQLEKQESGAGLSLYRQILESEDSYFLAFLDWYELESPFAEGRVQTVRQTFEDALG